MKRILAQMTLAALLAFSFTASPSFASAAQRGYFYAFDETTKPWAAYANDGNVTEDTLRLRFDPNRLIRNGYAVLTNSYGNVVWMESRYSGNVAEVRIDFLARDTLDCEGCIPIVYVGAASPQHLGQFRTNFVTLEEGWVHHHFDLSLEETARDAIPEGVVVAIGFTNLDSKAGAAECPIEQQMAVDNLHVTLFDAGE